MTTVPLVKAHCGLLEDVALPMLALARLRIRGLVNPITCESSSPVYSIFADTMIDGIVIDLPGNARARTCSASTPKPRPI